MLPSRRSIRLPGYDYSQPGSFFITLLTCQREPIFGQIKDTKEMILNQYGLIAHHEW
ncbi:MAG TPA: hypothetical protein VFF78_00975 [Anaerolineaceae bacterium]|nr:hypothetical protein [Anaerolineaceae bacterium]